MPVFTSLKVEEFYNMNHDSATGRFSGKAAGIRTTRGLRSGERRDFPKSMRERVVAYSGGRSADKTGKPVTGPKAPLYDRTTGRLNLSPVQRAFKQGLSEIIGRKQDSKRTSISGKGKSIEERKANYDKLSRDEQKKLALDVLLHNNPNLKGRAGTGRKVKTVGTIAGRTVKHISSKGKAGKFISEFRG